MGASVSELGPSTPAWAGAPADPARAPWTERLAGIRQGEVLRVELTNQQLRPREVRELCRALAGAGSVKALELDGSRIGDEGAAHLAERLAEDSSINFLDLANNGIRDAGAAALAARLGGNCALRHLDLTRNRIRGRGGLSLGRMLAANGGLRQLTLSENKVGAECARAIGAALPSNESLRILNLRECGLGPEGARSIAQGLSGKHAALVELSVGLNKIKDDGAAQFAKMLSTNCSIQELYVDDNRIGNLGGMLLAEALVGNRCLKTLWMVNNKLDSGAVDKFSHTLRENSTLRRLGITVSKSLPRCSVDALNNAHAMRRKERPAGESLPPLPADSKPEKVPRLELPATADPIFADSRGIPEGHGNVSDSGSDVDSLFAMVEEFDAQHDVAESRRVPRTARASRRGVSRQIMSEEDALRGSRGPEGRVSTLPLQLQIPLLAARCEADRAAGAKRGSRGTPGGHGSVGDSGADADSQFATAEEFDAQHGVAAAQRAPRTARASRRGASGQIVVEEAVRQIVMLDDSLQIDELKMISVHSTASIARGMASMGGA